jgi:hypothetical protein
MNLLRRVRAAISDGSFAALHREIEEIAEQRVRDD